MWQDLKRCEGPKHGIVKLQWNHWLIYRWSWNYHINKGTWKYSQSSSRGETISLILQPNQSFQIKNNPIKLCLKYCPAFQNSLYQQIYFQSTSTQCPKLPRWSFGLIKSTSSPLPLNVKCSQAGAFDLSSCYLVLVGLH